MIHATDTRTDAGAGGVSAFGKVYTPKELAELWKLSENSIRRLFEDRDGVFTLGDSNPRGRRGYVTLRIPEAIALQVWRERGGGGLA
jgi:hypothetical protein